MAGTIALTYDDGPHPVWTPLLLATLEQHEAVDTHDCRGDDAVRMAAALEAQGGLRDGDVILMHDGLGPGALRDGCAATVSLTQTLLERAAEIGLTAATVSDCEGVLA